MKELISFMGQEYRNESISQALQRGISVIYQELCLVPHMKVYENIMLGFEIGKGEAYSAAKTRERRQGDYFHAGVGSSLG